MHKAHYKLGNNWNRHLSKICILAKCEKVLPRKRKKQAVTCESTAFPAESTAQDLELGQVFIQFWLFDPALDISTCGYNMQSKALHINLILPTQLPTLIITNITRNWIPFFACTAEHCAHCTLVKPNCTNIKRGWKTTSSLQRLQRLRCETTYYASKLCRDHWPCEATGQADPRAAL